MHIDVSLYTGYSEHEWNQSWFFPIDQDSGWSFDQWTNTLDEYKVHVARMGVWSETFTRRQIPMTPMNENSIEYISCWNWVIPRLVSVRRWHC